MIGCNEVTQKPRFPALIASLGAQPAKLEQPTRNLPRGEEGRASLRGCGSNVLSGHAPAAVTRIRHF